MTMKATSSADHSGASRNEDRVTVFFGMKTVEDISVASAASGVIKWSCIVVVGIVIVDDYGIIKGTNRGSRSWRVQMIRRARRNRWSLRSLKERREWRRIRWYGRRREICSLSWTMISFSSHVDYIGRRILSSPSRQASSKVASANLWRRAISFISICRLGSASSCCRLIVCRSRIKVA